MKDFSLKNTVASIFAGDRAGQRLKSVIYSDGIAPDADTMNELVTLLNDDYKAEKSKVTAMNVKVGRWCHEVNKADEAPLQKGDYQVPAIKLNDDGVVYWEMVDTRKSQKDTLDELLKAFKKAEKAEDIDAMRKITIEMHEAMQKRTLAVTKASK